MNDLQRPETNQEHALCWRIFEAAPHHSTKEELLTMMSQGLADHRSYRDRRLKQGFPVHEVPVDTKEESV